MPTNPSVINHGTYLSCRVTLESKSGDSWIWLYCPGCQDAHAVPVTGPRGWTFDGNTDYPTLAPSLLVRGHRDGADYLCHSFVEAGKFRFLSDCTHAMKGQTVAVPDLPEWLR